MVCFFGLDWLEKLEIFEQTNVQTFVFYHLPSIIVSLQAYMFPTFPPVQTQKVENVHFQPNHIISA